MRWDSPGSLAGASEYHVTTTGVDGEQRVTVSEKYYETLSVGDTITIDHYSGLLGIPFDIVWEGNE